MRVVPDWREMAKVIKLMIGISFVVFMACIIFISCNEDFYLGKTREELHREMFEVDSLMRTIMLQIDSTSIEFEKFYIDAQRINNGHN